MFMEKYGTQISLTLHCGYRYYNKIRYFPQFSFSFSSFCIIRCKTDGIIHNGWEGMIFHGTLVNSTHVDRSVRDYVRTWKSFLHYWPYVRGNLHIIKQDTIHTYVVPLPPFFFFFFCWCVFEIDIFRLFWFQFCLATALKCCLVLTINTFVQLESISPCSCCNDFFYGH